MKYLYRVVFKKEEFWNVVVDQKYRAVAYGKIIEKERGYKFKIIRFKHDSEIDYKGRKVKK